MHSSQLDRQGKAIHLFADGRHLAHRIGSRRSHGLSSLAKERDRVFEQKWSQQEFLFAAQAQWRQASNEEKQEGTARQQTGDERRAVQDLFDSVEHEQTMLLLQERVQLLGE